MFNIKYNFLVAIKIILGILNEILLIRAFGISNNSDAYLLSISILVALQIILIMPVAQFLPFYNDYKKQSISKAHNFYNYLFLFSLIFGVLACLLFNLLLNNIINLFAMNIDGDRLIILKKLLSISIFGISFTTVKELITQLFNAEMKFSFPYFLEMLPTICTVSAQLWLIYTNSFNIYLLAYSQVFAYFLILISGTFLVNKYFIKYRFIFSFKDICAFFKNSISMQCGHGIYHFFFPVIINNFLVLMSKGYISYFYYARQIINIINSLMIGPSSRILKSRISKALSSANAENIRDNIRDFIVYSSLIFLLTIVPAYFLQKPILNLVSNNKLSPIDLHNIQMIFLSLVPWYYFMLIETPYVHICICAKKSIAFISVNSLFIIIVAIILNILPSSLMGIYTIGFATMIGQLSNYMCYKNMGKNIVKNIT